MVRLVDECLRGPLFDRALGLASPDVTVADPAVGTGTFLLGVLRRIASSVRDDQGAGAVPAAMAAAVRRIVGFELQFGPFAVAQLRLIAEMQALMKTPRNPTPAIPELQLFITDTLGDPYVEEQALGQLYEPVAKSRRAANRIKREQPITVVIGNPPYKEKAEGRGSWVERGTTSSDALKAPLDWWQPPTTWASVSTLGTYAISTSTSGAGRRGRCSAPATPSPLACQSRTALASSASSPLPASSTDSASNACATTCAAPAPTFG